MDSTPRKFSPRWIAGVLVVVFLIALPLDVPLSTWAHDSGLAQHLKDAYRTSHAIRFPGNGWYTVLAALVLIARDWRRRQQFDWPFWRDAAMVSLSGIFAASNAVFKWIFGRTRPFHGVPAFEYHPFRGGIRGLIFAEQNLSFPSGDATLAFAMAAALSMVLPRLWPAWWFLAVVVMVERIAENAHYPSDTVAGAALGVGCAFLARRIVQRLFPAVVSMASEMQHK